MGTSKRYDQERGKAIAGVVMKSAGMPEDLAQWVHGDSDREVIDDAWAFAQELHDTGMIRLDTSPEEVRARRGKAGPGLV
ncbi:hypothetical protein [Corynebacterium lowii]|uniref:Uncharacterized protein n=1 Tax=Corynebacterium lowii TaxID=1544413 RepID=A0A0Q1E334_9CORY|nr:hypothetical protein [Corynebacterium lowii]KQB87055.1 hypothetical protein Clow_00102 [Corynebacterium lowii]MDP9852363.1 hypothetical protein [Corynebacterium lowii]